jgi:outer membrane scaffolding protein for murein synthesis (MipA/OmpV family)
MGDGSVASIIPIESKWVELDVSVDAAFDADSSKNKAREGMHDLDYLLELGPQLTVHLARIDFASGAKGKLDLNLPARAVFSTDVSSVAHRGYVFNPKIVYRHENLAGTSINVKTSVGGSWATEKLMDYFYEVRPQFARPDRPEYDASGGYVGARALLVVSWDLTESLRAHTGASFSYHRLATNESSPLFAVERTFAVGASLVWTLWESERKVPSK